MSAKQAAHEEHNPKTDPEPGSNAVKDPAEWTTGGEPMTGAQASYLKTLSEEAGADEKEGYAEELTKAEASQRIDALRERTGKEK
ncbi:DUF3072 domain-containing protein [Roseomonas sp. CCTCC AB2023176]|uniref:DUF3072 domain-containing protein n=1 Tax=Roseomonas sp. CCTCC AB2023176 TaxID=3342640 RepID=UPI0035E39114